MIPRASSSYSSRGYAGVTVTATVPVRRAMKPPFADLTTDERIRRVLDEHAGLSVGSRALADTDDLYAAGMTSHAGVNVMLGLESEFDVEFPDELLKRSVFESVASIRRALLQLAAAQTA
jgi:acyl carrier protein